MAGTTPRLATSMSMPNYHELRDAQREVRRRLVFRSVEEEEDSSSLEDEEELPLHVAREVATREAPLFDFAWIRALNQ